MQEAGTLGYMLQGVSQQPERVQPDGHVREQVNWLPDPNIGLTTRPGSVREHEYPLVPSGSSFETVRIGDKDYLVACSDGEVNLYDYEGTIITIADPDDLSGYISNNMAVYATDDEIILVNKDVVVQRDPTLEEANVIRDWGYAYHLGGQFARTYRLTLTYADGDVAVGEYTTPDGSSSGDAEASSANNIMQQIRDSLMAHANFKSSTEVTRAEELLEILDDTTKFSLSASDGAQNAVMRAGVGEAKTFADVPRLGVEGAIIRVVGDTGSTVDDVWLRFDADGVTTLGDGLGLKGTWRETADPDDRLEFDLDTMPHVLTVENGTATLSYGDWVGRRTGNNDTSPVPSFVGQKINDVGEFSNRLWFLAGAFFITSRTNERLDFFRASAIQVIDTDPVDIRSTGEEKAGLLYGAAYDRDLLLFSSTGQFSIAGGAAFSPGNASMVRSTNFEMSSTVRPVVAGSTVLLPYSMQLFSGMNELKPSLELDSNAVEDLSKVTKKYIRGNVTDLAASGNAGIAMCLTDDDPRVVYVYNFLWEENRKVQSAWHKWEFSKDVSSIHIRDGVFFLWFSDNAQVYLCSMRPDKPEDADLYYHASMDLKRAVLLDENKVQLDAENYEFIANSSNADYAIGITVSPSEIVDLGSGLWEYTFPSFVPSNLLAGIRFAGTLKPNRPIYQDWRGNKVPQARVVVGKYVVDYLNSGGIDAVMESIYRGSDTVASNNQFPTDDDPTTDFGQALASGSFDIPWGDDNFNSSLVLQTSSLQPVTIVEARWWGQLFRGKN